MDCELEENLSSFAPGVKSLPPSSRTSFETGCKRLVSRLVVIMSFFLSMDLPKRISSEENCHLEPTCTNLKEDKVEPQSTSTEPAALSGDVFSSTSRILPSVSENNSTREGNSVSTTVIEADNSLATPQVEKKSSKKNGFISHGTVDDRKPEDIFLSELECAFLNFLDQFDDLKRAKNGKCQTSIEQAKTFFKKCFRSVLSKIPEGEEIVKAVNIIRDFFIPVAQKDSVACQTSSVNFSEQCCQTENLCHMVEMGIQKNDEDAETEKEKFKQMVIVLQHDFNKSKERIHELTKNNNYLMTKVNELHEALKNGEKELRETLLELGRLSVENTKMIRENKMRMEAQRNQLSNKPTSRNSLRSISPSFSSITSDAEAATKKEAHVKNGNAEKPNAEEAMHATVATNASNQISAHAIQVSREESSEREVISLGNIPTTTVERGLYNNYKLLILTSAHSLLTSDVSAFKEWVKRSHSIDDAHDVADIFWELDKKGIISASNLSPLREFFEKIQRIDLTHLIDMFLLGDYSLLRTAHPSGVSRLGSRITNSQIQLQSSERERVNLRKEERSASGVRTSGNFHEVNESFFRTRPNSQDAFCKPRSPVRNFNTGKERIFPQNVQGVVVADGPAQVARQAPADGRHIDAYPTSGNNKTTASDGSSCNPTRKHWVDLGSNGQKLSKFASHDSGTNRRSNPHSPGDDPDDDDDSQWLCNHYKRRCHVKFDCCNKYWPCHRCHNNESNCGEKKLRSRDTKFVKCVRCKTEQPFTETSQYCVNCNLKLAKYFCAICKHLTGTDDNPYHCEKCGICRIHSNRSFHCDVCGVCLDVQLRGNHKCRAGSAHDECCICLEIFYNQSLV